MTRRTPAARGLLRGRASNRALALVVLPLVVAACADARTEDSRSDPGQPPVGSPTVSQAINEDVPEQVELRSFVTRPDLSPPAFRVGVSESRTPGYIFLAPKKKGAQMGPLIIDDDGEVVWAHPRADAVSDFKVQTYRDAPVLTWWEGTTRGWGVTGGYTIMDASYEQVARVSAGGELAGDLHDMQITDEGTALILAYEPEPADLSEVGGPADGVMLNNYIQEIDIETGDVLFEWSAADHVPMADSFAEIGRDSAGDEGDPYDWFHINSVDEDGEGRLLVSARNTHAVYSLDRTTGEVRWTLGGRSNDFAMEPGTEFVKQHDARRMPDGALSLFDNRSSSVPLPESRVLVLDVDERSRRARVVRELRHPDGVLARAQANAQVLPTGAVVVGWGSAGRVSEFSADDDLVLDIGFAPADSYRAFRYPWTGRPTDPPAVVASRRTDGQVEVHMSWNGATGVAEWRVLGGARAGELAPLAVVPRKGFETSLVVEPVDHVAVAAIDSAGEVIARSGPHRVHG